MLAVNEEEHSRVDPVELRRALGTLGTGGPGVGTPGGDGPPRWGMDQMGNGEKHHPHDGNHDVERRPAASERFP